MSVISIITARGGSKRIPQKNIKEFCGKPILSYSIDAAINSGIFDEVMVSTDDSYIAKVAQKYGANVPFMRSDKNSDDYSTTEDVLKEVLEKYNEMGNRFDLACCIYPTAPFVSVDRLKKAFDIISNEDCDSVFPIVNFSFPPQRGLTLVDGFLHPTNPKDYPKRSQDLQPIYHDCGQFYFFRVARFLESGSIVERAKPLLIDEMEVQDIDTLTDWKIAEFKYSYLKRNE